MPSPRRLVSIWKISRKCLQKGMYFQSLAECRQRLSVNCIVKCIVTTECYHHFFVRSFFFVFMSGLNR